MSKRAKLVSKLYLIMGKTGITRNELSFDQQNVEINNESDLKDFSVDKLEAILNRAQTLEYYYSDPQVQEVARQMEQANSDRTLAIFTPYAAHMAIQSYNAIYQGSEVADIASEHLISSLVRLLKSYHVNTVMLSEETADWSKEDDGYCMATPKYLVDYYNNKSNRLRNKAENLTEPYVIDSNESFGKVNIYDIQAELQDLANYISDHANSEAVNNKYYQV